MIPNIDDNIKSLCKVFFNGKKCKNAISGMDGIGKIQTKYKYPWKWDVCISG